MELNKLYKYKIDMKIEELLNNNIIFVYGGYTEQDLLVRQKQHIKHDKIFNNMEIEKYFKLIKNHKLNK